MFVISLDEMWTRCCDKLVVQLLSVLLCIISTWAKDDMIKRKKKKKGLTLAYDQHITTDLFQI